MREGKLFCYIKAKPIDQLANKNVIEFLSDILSCPKKVILIKSGLTSKIKKIQILGYEEENIKKKFLDYLSHKKDNESF